MRGSRRRGFTLLELMVGLVITTILAAAIVAMLAHHRNHTRWQNALILWSGESRAALNTLSRDVRQAQTLEVQPRRLVLGGIAEGGEATAIVYFLEGDGDDGVLVRQAQHRRQVLAREVSRFDIERRPGRLEVTLVFEKRFGDYRGEATHATTVALLREASGGGS